MSPRKAILTTLLLAGCSDSPPSPEPPFSPLDYIQNTRDLFCLYLDADLPAELKEAADELFSGLCAISRLSHESAVKHYYSNNNLYAFTVYEDLITFDLLPHAMGPFASMDDCQKVEAIARQHRLITAPCDTIGRDPSTCAPEFRDLPACRKHGY